MMLLPCTRLGPYEVIGQVGHGGMGEVYRARDTRLDRDVAIKILPQQLSENLTALKRFEREAKALAALSHPNILTIYDIGIHEDLTFVVTELLEGESLRERIKHSPPTWEKTIEIISAVIEGLVAAHSHGIIHRDLKPENIFITTDERVKILDFGLAKRFDSHDLQTRSDLETESRATEEGTILGTVPYMSPEQARGEMLDQKSDIFSIGTILYELLTGHIPFQGPNIAVIIYKILNENPPSVCSVRRELPNWVDRVIERALAKEKERRYSSTSEMLKVIKGYQEGLRISVTALPIFRLLLRRARSPWVAVPAAAILVALIFLGVLFFQRQSTAPARTIRLAVLPFANLSGDPEQEYLSDGLTQEMIAQLGRLHPQSLSVIARTSVMRYKKTDTPIDQIGRELRVDYFLEGSARHEAGRVRVTAELIQARDQAQLWADTYEREVSGILALESEVARNVASALALKLLPAEQSRLANVHAVDPEAHDAYLKGLQHWYKLTPADFDAAEGYFQLALKKDPNYALPYVGMALLWGGRNQTGLAKPSEAAPKAMAAALKAVELDNTLAEAHYSVAIAKTWQVWDLSGAGPEWERAIELNPNFPDARAFYSHFLMIMRRPDEAMAQIKRALELDPFNSLFQGIYAQDLVFLHRYDDAIAQAKSTLRSTPNDPLAISTLWSAYRLKGMKKEALTAAKAYCRYYGDPAVDQSFDRGYAEAGYNGAMKAAAKAVEARFRTDYVCPLDIATLYLEAGDKGQALAWLEKGYAERDPNMPYLFQPDWDALRSEPRFQDLLRRMGIPQNEAI